MSQIVGTKRRVSKEGTRDGRMGDEEGEEKTRRMGVDGMMRRGWIEEDGRRNGRWEKR